MADNSQEKTIRTMCMMVNIARHRCANHGVRFAGVAQLLSIITTRILLFYHHRLTNSSSFRRDHFSFNYCVYGG